MKFLIDAALSPVAARLLSAGGHDAVHVYEYEMHASPDWQILRRAEQEARILVSADTDFGTLLALTGATAPSVVLFRGGLDRSSRLLVDLLLGSLSSVSLALAEGAIVEAISKTFAAPPPEGGGMMPQPSGWGKGSYFGIGSRI